MEGELQQCTKGIFGGNKKVYGIIDGSDFVVYKGDQIANNQKEVIRISLQSSDKESQDQGITEVAPHGKGVNFQFVLSVCDPRQKDKKKK